MKLFYSYIGRLHPYPSYLWRILRDKHNKITSSVIKGHHSMLSFRHFCILCFMLFSIGGARSQSRAELGAVNKQTIKTLNIGDTIPDELWDTPLQVVNHPDGKETITLSEYKDKLIILDFWATWCVPCIKAFPDLEDLSEEYNDDLQIVLVTSEEGQKIAEFLAKRETPLLSLVDDQDLKIAFPKNSVPHEVWIKDRKVFAITDAYHVNANSIKAIIDGKLTALPEKKVNYSYNRNEPLLVDGNGGDKNDLLYHSVITGYLDGIGGGGTYTDTLGRFKLRALNATALQLYTFAAGRINYFLYIKNRRLNKISFDKDASDLNTSNPDHRQHFFCYELIVPKSLEQKAPYMMIDDLNKFYGDLYGIYAEVKKISTKCWVLRQENNSFSGRTSLDGTGVTKEGASLVFKNQPFGNYFYSLAEANQDQPYPFVDKTFISDNVDMEVLLDEPDIDKTIILLRRYGLSVTFEESEVEMLIITDVEKQNKQ